MGPRIIGIAAIIGGLVLLFCILPLFFLSEDELRTFLITSGLLGGFIFVVALILGLRDWLRESFRRRSVRQRLLQRTPASDDVAAEGIAKDHLPTFLETRRSIAVFFDVPDNRLRAGDLLDLDYGYLALETALNSFVIERAMAGHAVRVSTWQFDSSGLATLADFVRALDLTLAEMKVSSLGH